MRKSRRGQIIGALAALAATGVLAGASHAATKITVGFSPSAETTALYVAKERGIFEKNGLDVELTPISLGAYGIAALQAGSIQVGSPTTPTFLQAIENGLDLVAIGGISLTSHRLTQQGLVAKQGLPIKTAQDLKGRRVGVPGINAVMHVFLRQWLVQNGVSIDDVKYVEVAGPQQVDILKGDSVDAIVTFEPFLSRIIAANTGTLVTNLLNELPEDQISSVYAVPRAWAEQNKDTVRAFQASLREATAIAKADFPGARPELIKYLKMTEDLVNRVPQPSFTDTVTLDQLKWWIGVLKTQKMISGDVDAGRILWK